MRLFLCILDQEVGKGRGKKKGDKQEERRAEPVKVGGVDLDES